MTELIIIIASVLFLVIFCKGLVKIIDENFLIGLVFLLLLTPLFILWALYEGIVND